MIDISPSIKRFRKYYRKKKREPVFEYVTMLFFLLLLYIILTSWPTKFPAGSIVSIEEGAPGIAVLEDLKEKRVIRSVFMAKVHLKVTNENIVAGDYIFKNKKTLSGVLRQITAGEYGLEPVEVTIPEGLTVIEMAELYQEKLGETFNADKFIEAALPEEGYLFPDTYKFLPNVKPETIIATMEDRFYEQVSTIEQEIIDFGQPLEAVVIMASLLEEEARRLETRRKISGVLWNRLEIDMPLQVDAVFPYIIDKNTYEVTLDDLEFDSPYNTYKYKGLPIGPITNPSLDAILAAVTPIESDYIFYLSDRSGNTYFAVTFEEHKKNRLLYLD